MSLMDDIDYGKSESEVYGKDAKPSYITINTHLAYYKPRVVCLCGSTRFMEEFQEANRKFTLSGYIVLTVGFFAHAKKEYIEEVGKTMLDTLHKRKIDLASEIFVLNVDGYIGESTKSEIKYAEERLKHITYLEPLSNE